MAISPPSDIVLDVARAADGEALEVAKARLRGMADAASATKEAFEAAAPQVRQALRRSQPETFVKFEGMVLQTFVQSMLPSQAENVFGSGVAGEMWKSLLAEKVAAQMAERGGIGIAQRVLGDFYMDGDRRVAVTGIDGNPAATAVNDQQSLLSIAMVDEIQRNIVRSLADAATDRAEDE